MSEWKKVKIGDIFAIEKGSLQSSKNTPGKYDFITAASEWKKHNSYDHDCEAIVYAVAASGSLGRAHYVNGKFIASNLCFILTEKNKDKYPVNFLFYQIIFEMLRDEIVSKTKTGTSKESINRGNFSNYEIPYFPIDFQLANYQRFVDAKNTIKTLIDEYEKQKSYAKQLRQNILQEAIEGKLTTDWRKQHPVQKGNPDYDAKALFDKNQTEKQKKGKKQKPLPTITEDEKPFAIPTGWKWVRLGDVAEILGGYAYKSHFFKEEGNNLVLRLGNIRTGYLRYEASPAFVSDDIAKDTASYKILKNDIIVTMTGTRGKRDYLYTLLIDANHVSKYNMFLNQRLANIRSLYSPKYVYDVLQNDVLKEPIFESATGSANQANIGMPALQKWAIPYPPLAEQNEIVTRVEKLLETITQLETQIATRETLTKQLMQGLLKDAFEEG